MAVKSPINAGSQWENHRTKWVNFPLPEGKRIGFVPPPFFQTPNKFPKFWVPRGPQTQTVLITVSLFHADGALDNLAVLARTSRHSDPRIPQMNLCTAK